MSKNDSMECKYCEIVDPTTQKKPLIILQGKDENNKWLPVLNPDGTEHKHLKKPKGGWTVEEKEDLIKKVNSIYDMLLSR